MSLRRLQQVALDLRRMPGLQVTLRRVYPAGSGGITSLVIRCEVGVEALVFRIRGIASSLGVQAHVTFTPSRTRSIAAQIPVETSVAAIAGRVRPVTASIGIETTVTAVLTAEGAGLVLSILVEADVAATVSRYRSIAASSDVEADVTSVERRRRAVQAQIEAEAETSATAIRERAIPFSASIEANVTADVTSIPGEEGSVLDTLTAAYQFESGSLLVDSLGGPGLSNVNSVTSTAGKSGNAATFGGNAQGTGTALTRTFSYTAGAFSVSLWAYRASTGTNFALLDLDTQNRIFQRNTGDFVFRASNVDLTIAGNTYWPSATWTHFAFVFSGSTHLLYIDGTLRGTAAGGGGGGSATAYIGNLSGGSWVLNGQIDELYFANGTAWDASQVAELYNSGTGIFL